MSSTPDPAADPATEADDERRPAASPRPAAPVSRPAAQAPRPAALIFDDPLSQQSSDDTDRGWGERPGSGDSAADLARFLDEKPPHHL